MSRRPCLGSKIGAASGGRTGRGTGLGLAIVKHAAERLGGTVSISNALERGTTVEVRVPLRPARATT